MSRPGRKRKAGKREPSGRPKRETAHEIRSPVGEQRCRRMGWPIKQVVKGGHVVPHVENIRKAVKAAYGTEQGILWGRGLISDAQLAAADQVQMRDAEYQQVKGLPPRHASAATLKGFGGEPPEDTTPADKVKWFEKRNKEVVKALTQANALSVVARVVVLQQQPSDADLTALKRGLSAVALSLGLIAKEP